MDKFQSTIWVALINRDRDRSLKNVSDPDSTSSDLITMRKVTRLAIAISELGGATFLMIGSAFAALTHVEFPGWYLAVTESFGVIAIIAGYRLIQNRREGVTVSLLLQAAQVIQVLSPNCLYRAVLGPYLVIILSADKTLIQAGFMGELTIGWKGPEQAAVGVNVVAAALLLLLARASLQQRGAVRAVTSRSEERP